MITLRNSRASWYNSRSSNVLNFFVSIVINSGFPTVQRSNDLTIQRALLHLLDDLFQFSRHLGNGFAAELHSPVFALGNDDTDFAQGCILVGKIFAVMGATALLTVQGGPGDTLGNREQACEIEGCVPAGVELAVAGDADAAGALPKALEAFERAGHFVLAADNADKVLHHFLQIELDLVGPFKIRAGTGVAVERFQSEA